MFIKDTRTETFLEQMEVDYRFTTRLGFKDLFPGWRTVNLARPVPIRDEAVIEYALLHSNKSMAPAPILHRKDDGYHILDGVQRIAAAELEEVTKLSAYVVSSASPKVLLAISLLANARLQGRAEPPEWTRRQAVQVLVIEKKMSAEEVARMGGWRKVDIETLAKTLDWNAVIQSIGGPELPDTMINLVSSQVLKKELRADSRPIAEFLSLLKSAKFSAADAEPYVEDFFRPVTKNRKRFKVLTERLEAFKEDPEVLIRTLGRKSAGLAPDVNLRRAMRAVTSILTKLQESDEKLLFVDEFFKISKEIDKGLHALASGRKKSPRK